MTESSFRFQRRVVYADCTVGNHVYYARYLDMLEEARGELFRKVGAPLGQLQEAGVIFPVVAVSVLYAAPARYDDVLMIEVFISRLGPVRLDFGFAIGNATGKPLVSGQTQHVCTTLEEKPRRMPKELIEQLRPYFRSQPDATPS